jgi:hypothetical protein
VRGTRVHDYGRGTATALTDGQTVAGFLTLDSPGFNNGLPGSADRIGTPQDAFLRVAGRAVTLPAQPEVDAVFGLNSLTVLVGRAQVADRAGAARWSPQADGTFRFAPLPPPGQKTARALDINDAGVAVGSAVFTPGGGTRRAVAGQRHAG